MEPLNLLVSLSHFANAKPTIPPKQRKRRATTKPNPAEPPHASHTTGPRRALDWFRTTTAR
jgi:hypothetical protein